MPGRLGMGLECCLGLGCLRTIGWLVVELFCFLGGGGGVGGEDIWDCWSAKDFWGFTIRFWGGWRISFGCKSGLGCWVLWHLLRFLIG